VATGDINGDGIPDIIIGYDNFSTGQRGCYIYNGRASGWPTSPYSIDGL
jgi:hypothetical protein